MDHQLWNQVLREARARGLDVVDCGAGHLQIVGGPLLVNYYPQSKNRSAYVAGTTARRTHITPKEAVEMCFTVPKVDSSTPLNRRKGKYRALRKRMLMKSTECFWCGAHLTINNSTVDHVVPLSRGGLDHSNNRVLACEPCNNKRGSKMPELNGEEDERGI